jgi:hypothetical protein
MTQTLINITDMTNTEVADLLNVTPETEEKRCRIDFHYGSYNLSMNARSGKSYHKSRKVTKSPVLFLIETLPEFGYELVSLDRSERKDSGLKSRGVETYYEITVKKI